MTETAKNVKVSIIIPVYNASKTLPECLDSILNQTMPEFEAICIDDGSADDSWEILTAYALKDSRIRIIHQENQGPGKTRNHGLELAAGEYIIFVDSDDYIKPMALESICRAGYAQDADIVLYDGDKFDAVTRKRIRSTHFLRMDFLPKNLDVFSLLDCPETIFQLTSPGPWSRAVRRELIEREKLCFSDLKNSEYLFFSYSAMATAERIAFVPQKLYMYRVGQTTNVESGKAKAPVDFIEAYLELYRKLAEKSLFELCKKSFGLRFCSSIIHAIRTIDSESARKEICERLCDEDVTQMHVLDQSDAFYNNSREVRQVHYLLRDYRKDPITTPKVSVIIPVFNVENYLEDCLESLLNQTMPDFEVLCMDDGSTDGSIDLLTLYSRLDSRIKVFFGENEGAAVQRNRGIDASVGEYLYFMDSDDMAVDTLLEKTYTTAKNADADIVVLDAFILNEATQKIEQPTHCFRKAHVPLEKSVFSVSDIYEHIFQLATPAPWSRLFRREFVLRKQLRYQNLQNTNDAYFTQTALALAERITTLDERLYLYRKGMASNTQSKKDKAPECVIDAYLAIQRRLVTEGIWTLCEKSWICEFLAVMCFSFKTLSARESYKRLYHRLTSPEITSLGIFEHDKSYYHNYTHCELVKKFLSSPIKFADVEERDVKVLIPGNCQNPVVSVIIPVYNVEEYLADCLTSIQNQTLKDIEIICVDDGSTDSSLSILCQAAEADPRICVLVQKNSGLSAARNTGIQAARGKYLYYLDSDDMLEPDALQFLIDTVEDNDLECILFGGKAIYDSEELLEKHGEYSDYYRYKEACTDPMAGADLLVLLKNVKEYRASACMQLAKTELIRNNNIHFYDGIVHEDNLYTLEVLLHSRRCMAIPGQFYLRRIRENSIMTATVSVANFIGYLICYTETLKLMDKFDLTAPQYEAVYSIQDTFIYHVRKYYDAISEDERNWVYAFCTGSQRSVYRTLTNLFTSAPKQSSHSSGSAAQNKRLDDHDTALRYAQEELAVNRNRLNDHDTALRYAQMELAELRQELHNSLSRRIARIVLWLPRKIKRFLRRILFVSARE